MNIFTREEVYRQARENTWRLLPVDFRSMGEVMEDALFLPSLDEILKLYVLTNRWKNYGAPAAHSTFYSLFSFYNRSRLFSTFFSFPLLFS